MDLIFSTVCQNIHNILPSSGSILGQFLTTLGKFFLLKTFGHTAAWILLTKVIDFYRPFWADKQSDQVFGERSA
jgi:hypothetical protein